jgi:hypothetical protein
MEIKVTELNAPLIAGGNKMLGKVLWVNFAGFGRRLTPLNERRRR